MMILTVLVIALLAFLGLAVGSMLSGLAKEEIPQVAKYLKILEPLLFSLIIFFSFFSQNAVMAGAISIIVFFASLRFDAKRWTFMFCGILVVLSARYGDILTTATLAFIYAVSISTSSRIRHFKKKPSGYAMEILKIHYPYLISTAAAYLCYIFLL